MSTFIEKIGDKIVHEVAWDKIFYFLFAIACVYVIQKLLDFKISELVKSITEEIKALAAIKVTRGSINALGLVIFATALLGYLFVDGFRSIVEVFETVQGHENKSFIEFTVATFMFGILTLLSALTVRE